MSLSSGFQQRAKYLGYAGLLPFVAALAMLALGPIGVRELSLRSLLTYSAVILGFMGAVHWGRAMVLKGDRSGDAERVDVDVDRGDRANALCWSVVPALIGWSALFFTPRVALVVLAVGFVALYLFERSALRQDADAHWYMPLRLRLTGVVVVVLILAAVLL